MKLAHEQGAKVLLDGQGADEIFGGYVYYYSYYFYELLTGLKWGSMLKEMMAYWKAHKNTYPHAMLGFMLLPGPVKGIVWKNVINKWIDHEYLEKECGPAHDPRWKLMDLNTALSLTLFKSSIPELLRWEDKNSMRWSIETRPPFLDVNLVESVLSMPSDKKLKDGKRKVVFKEAMKDMLPDIINRRNDKIGFATPVDMFFRDEKIVEFCKEIIYSDSFRRRPYWKWDQVERMFRDHVENRRNYGDTIFKWINLEVWLRKFFLSQN